MRTVEANIKQIKEQIDQLSKTSDIKNSHPVQLLAVSKTKPVEDILMAYHAGHQMFGENYVQEGVDKIQYFQQANISLQWHFIGVIQSNKTRIIATHFDWVQTIDRNKIAQRLSEQRPEELPPLNVLIQVNIDYEETKSGVRSEAELNQLAELIVSLPHLCLRGLMSIPVATTDSNAQEQSFQALNTMFKALQWRFPKEKIDTLSMGMSNDMPSAIKCGSTMVRIGTALFGKRSYST